jgi:hypothetical protein
MLEREVIERMTAERQRQEEIVDQVTLIKVYTEIRQEIML